MPSQVPGPLKADRGNRISFAISNNRSDDAESRCHEIGESGLPVKIVWGKVDFWIPLERATSLADLIAGHTDVVLVEEAGHIIQLDQPERLAAEIALFLCKVDGSGSIQSNHPSDAS